MSTRYDLLNYLGPLSLEGGYACSGAAHWLRMSMGGRLGSARRGEGLDTTAASNKTRVATAERRVNAPSSAAG
jgi:hypothetical protein